MYYITYNQALLDKVSVTNSQIGQTDQFSTLLLEVKNRPYSEVRNKRGWGFLPPATPKTFAVEKTGGGGIHRPHTE